jgi:G3E family GTPase
MVSITVVTGFLGSGKTSLIAHLLDSTPDRPIAVIVNELALQSIDSAYLHGGEHIDSADGPLLRSVSGGRAGAGKAPLVIEHIEDLLGADSRPEAIVIETSGSSPAAALVAAIEAAPRLRETVRVDSVITVVDVTSLPRYWQDPQLRPLLQEQLESADMIVLNKVDRAGFWTERKATRIVRKVNPAAAVGTTEYGRLPVEEIILSGRRGPRESRPVRSGGGDSPRFQPVVARQLLEAKPLHPERLHQWLNRDWPGLIRVKGFVWIASDMDNVFVIDAAADQREVGMEGTWYAALPDDERPDGPDVQAALAGGAWGDRRQSLVVIGLPDAVEREMRNLRQCLLSATELDRGPHGWSRFADPIREQFRRQEASAETDAVLDQSR